MNPDRKTRDDLLLEIASDQVNASMYIAWVLGSIFSGPKSKREKFEPLRTYPGSPFNPKKKTPMFDPAAAIGGYRRMDLDAAKKWASERGLPV